MSGWSPTGVGVPPTVTSWTPSRSPSARWRGQSVARVLRAEAAYGSWAAKPEYYSGLQGHLLIDGRGVAVGLTLTAAHVDERAAAYDLLRTIEGLVLGDKGSLRPPSPDPGGG